MAKNIQGRRIQIQGIVQGVGFRPFIYNLAQEYQLKGWVKNNSNGVEIEVIGDLNSLDSFLNNIKPNAPKLSRINNIHIDSIPSNGYSSFVILDSTSSAGEFVPVAPDIAICSDCLKEFNDPKNRRYHYPFINCTNCGPRFTIIKDTPYDRPLTTMADFKMCANCAEEYHDPTNRRFHAQPIACPDCGPKIWLEKVTEIDKSLDEVTSISQIMVYVQREITDGKIIAIKGLGGFHLTCDATNSKAVKTLRNRKKRPEKPFALMMPDIETVQEHCYLSENEKNILESPEKPIVILQKRSTSSIVSEITPGQNTIGVMLPYTPLHYLLFTLFSNIDEIKPSKTLVMTSGNSSNEPIAFKNQEAKIGLKEISDIYILHNRPIHIRCDDSLIRIINTGKNDTQYSIRRARGYAPLPLELPWKSLPILAVGAELKNTICFTRNEFAISSQYIGDLQNYETFAAFENIITHFEQLYKITPQVIACDLHPDYLSTRYAYERSIRTGEPIIQVQHHHAHIASVMVENSIPEGEPVIGLAFDGTGYGDDGNIWGGEILIATYGSYERVFSLNNFPLPGGDLAIRYPSRIALALLWQENIDWFPELPCMHYYCADDLLKIKTQLDHHINTPLTSSMGRLFDAVASLLNVRQHVNYEGQAAIELEAICQPDIISHYEINFTDDKFEIKQMLLSIIDEVLSGVPSPVIASKFHNTIILLVSILVNKINKDTGIRTVALSGGVWQNLKLLEGVISILQTQEFNVLIHKHFPPNDGGISLGQVSIAQHKFKST